MNSHEMFIELFNQYQIEIEKFKGKNKSAAPRARKILSEISKLTKILRAEIQEEKSKF
jgi:hypothetical protein